VTKLAVVSYLNTIPMLEEFEHEKENFELIKAVPSKCAELLNEGLVDGALLPVGSLIMDQLVDCELISDYGIIGKGKVDSVFLLSNCPLEKISKVVLDKQSRTSNLLVQVLFKGFWKLEMEFISEELNENEIEDPNIGKVLIGDKAILKEKDFLYKYDLSEHWWNWKKLPFVFATWVGTPSFPSGKKPILNNLIFKSIQQLDKIVERESIANPHFDVKDYLTNRIHYNLDETARLGLKEFIQETEALRLPRLVNL
jgi:chorismate dehydratase